MVGLLRPFFISFSLVYIISTCEKIILTTFSKISSGHFSINTCSLALRSSDLRCSQSITPVVSVLESSGTCKGNSLFVLVIGHKIANFAFLLKTSLLTTTAGLKPACSCPFCGLKLSFTISPCFTIVLYPLFRPNQFLLACNHPCIHQKALLCFFFYYAFL